MSPALNFKQELTGAFGQPIAENPTQAMMEAAYAHHGLEWRYLSIEVTPEGLEAAVAGAKAMGFIGFNCTIPHKVAVIEYLDGLGESAELMGAVNCVVRRNAQWIGENTDGKGFLESVARRMDVNEKRVVLFGAGGAARAISVELSLEGVSHITVVNRSVSRGEALTDLLQSRVSEKTGGRLTAEFVPWQRAYEVPQNTDLVINATSIGLFPDTEAVVDVEYESLQTGMLVADVIPNPPRTRFLERAGDRGCEIIDGLEMLVAQGAIGIRHWAGIDADTRVMRESLERVFSV